MVSPIHRKETTVAYTQKDYSALLSNGNDSTYKHAHFTSVPNTKKKDFSNKCQNTNKTCMS